MTFTHSPYAWDPTVAPEKSESRELSGDTGTGTEYEYQPAFSADLGAVTVGAGDTAGEYTDPINFARITDILTFYVLRDFNIYQYLIDNNSVISPLFEAIVPIRNTFGSDTTPALEIFEDIDSGGHRELFVLIPTPRNELDAGMRKMRLFVEGWFLQELPHVSGKLNFDLELI